MYINRLKGIIPFLWELSIMIICTISLLHIGKARFKDTTLGVEGRNADRVHKTLLPSYWRARTHVCSKIHHFSFTSQGKKCKIQSKNL